MIAGQFIGPESKTGVLVNIGFVKGTASFD